MNIKAKNKMDEIKTSTVTEETWHLKSDAMLMLATARGINSSMNIIAFVCESRSDSSKRLKVSRGIIKNFILITHTKSFLETLCK